MTQRLVAPGALAPSLLAAFVTIIAPVAIADRALAATAASAPLVAVDAASAATKDRPPARARSDPLDSAECRRALTALNAQEAALAATSTASAATEPRGRRHVDSPLAAARRQAATACLATRADLPVREVRPPPIGVAPLAVAPAPPAAAVVRGAPPAPKTRHADRPYAITSCDAGGCWANDGSRLNRVGPNLWGPHGICTVQGSLVQCP